MTTVPLAILFEGDFVLKLLPVESEDTMDTLAEKARGVTIGIHVQDQPGKAIRVRKEGNDEPYPRDMTVETAGLTPMDGVNLYFE